MLKLTRYLFVAGALLAAVVASLAFGATETTFQQIVSEISQQRGVVYQFRLPRTLSAVLVGFCFAVFESIWRAS